MVLPRIIVYRKQMNRDKDSLPGLSSRSTTLLRGELNIKGLKVEELRIFYGNYKIYLDEKLNILQISEYLNIPLLYHAIEYLLRNYNSLSNTPKRFEKYYELIAADL